MGSTPWIFNLFQINSTIEQEHEREHHLVEIILSLRGNDQMFSERFGLWRKIPLFFDPTRLRQLEPFQLFFFFFYRTTFQVWTASGYGTIVLKSKLFLYPRRNTCSFLLPGLLSLCVVYFKLVQLKFFEISRSRKKVWRVSNYYTWHTSNSRDISSQTQEVKFFNLCLHVVRFKGKVDDFKLYSNRETFATSCSE